MAALLAGGLVAMAAERIPESLTLVSHPVSVVATIVGQLDDFFEVDLAVGSPCTCSVKTEFGAPSRAAAKAALRAAIAWRAPYLFVRTQCGGGNAWGCNTELVWRIAKKECQRVGEFVVAYESQAGAAFHDGSFHDWYDKLESSLLPISHAHMPGFEVILQETNGGLVPDLERTWQANSQRFQEHSDAIARIAPGIMESDRDRHEGPMADLAEAIAIAKYCGKSSVLEDLLAQARQLLPPQEVQDLVDMAQGVGTGEVLAVERMRRSCVA